MTLARAVGLTTVEVRVSTIAGIDCLIVERFDRTVDADGGVLRIHQEDACQALAVPPEHKYEVRKGGGGPELSQIARLLDLYAADPLAQLDRLAAVAAFTVLIANADAHGKNLALLHTPPGTIELAPLYDQVPTRLWPQLQSDAAMTIDAMVNLDKITAERIGGEAKSWSHSPARAVAAATSLAERLLEATTDGSIDPDGRVAVFVRERTERFLNA
jgi:serine/threonine-protein kinase HipA